jgi:hypothetical protein
VEAFSDLYRADMGMSEVLGLDDKEGAHANRGIVSKGSAVTLRAKGRSGRWYSRRKHFTAQKALCYARDGDRCQFCQMPMLQVSKPEVNPDSNSKPKWDRHCHHFLAEKWVRTYVKGADPHIMENLAAVHSGCHARATAAERLLFDANWLGFLREMNILGVSAHVLNGALSALTVSAEKRRNAKAASLRNRVAQPANPAVGDVGDTRDG